MEKEKKIKIPSPEELLNKFLEWFDSKKRLAFFTALIIGFITHITMLTETIMSQDGLWNSMQYSRAGDWELTLGRWGIEIIERLNSFIAIPTIATISCIVTMAIASFFLIDIFDLKNKISIVFVSAILVITPTFTATVLYIYTSFAYCFNFLISIITIWLIYRSRNKYLGFILGVLCITFSFSIYQSYIGVTIGLCIMLSILNLLKENSKIKDIFFNIFKIAGAVIIGGILYYTITMILLRITGLKLSTYKNANSTSIFDILKNLRTTLFQTYKDFGIFFFGDSIVYNANYKRDLIYALFWIILAISTIINLFLIKDTKKVKILRIVLIILFSALIPIGLNIVDIMVPETTIYILTATQMILIIPFALSMIENLNKFVFIKWLAVLSVLLITGTYYLADHTSYAALKLTYNQAYSTTIRIMDRIENTNGYSKDLPVLFGGIVGNNNFPRTSNLYGFTIGSIVNNVVFHGTYGGQIGTWQNYLKVFLGLDVTFCEPDIYYDIINGEVYKEMEIFPAENSVRVMDGVIVVKLSEDPPLPY